MELTGCPEWDYVNDRRCGATAEINDRFVLDSTEGPIEFFVLHCVRKHSFNMPVAMHEDLLAKDNAAHRSGASPDTRRSEKS